MVKTILLHVCCGPCSFFPTKILREEGLEPVAFFYNPNIHPFREFKNRLKAMKEMAERLSLELLAEKNYGLKDYLHRVAFQEDNRCLICYRMRLETTARKVRELGLWGFSTTLLYSRYQQHNLIRRVAEDLAYRYNVRFVYRDFRQGWPEGQKRAREWGIYLQSYCGCIFSEQERYDKKFKIRQGGRP
ncbi:epoxyqueuosine reductase QueH [Thermosulfuriphilus sp.]